MVHHHDADVIFLHYPFPVAFFIPHPSNMSELPYSKNWLTVLTTDQTHDEQSSDNKKRKYQHYFHFRAHLLFFFFWVREIRTLQKKWLSFCFTVTVIHPGLTSSNDFFFKCNHHLDIAGNLNKLKFTEFSDLQSTALAQILARCDTSLNLMLKLHYMSQWVVKILLLLLIQWVDFHECLSLGQKTISQSCKCTWPLINYLLKFFFLWNVCAICRWSFYTKPQNCNFTQHSVDLCSCFT
jgi:hypothetical protein